VKRREFIAKLSYSVTKQATSWCVQEHDNLPQLLARQGDAVKSSRRQLLQLAGGTAALSTLSRIARALDYPTRPVTLIVPWAAGGTTDVALRALATATEKYLGPVPMAPSAQRTWRRQRNPMVTRSLSFRSPFSGNLS
jgi:hypothetical protein